MLFIALAAAPFLYRAWTQSRAVHLTKVAVLVAFSGQLAARGDDLYAAAQLAVQHANGGQDVTLVELSALDDQGSASSAQEQARGAAADPAVRAVLCCSTIAAERAVAAVLPRRDRFVALAAMAAPSPGAEAKLARQVIGGASALVISDSQAPPDGRAPAFSSALRAAGYSATRVAIDISAGGTLNATAAAVAKERPDLIVLDMEYPAAAVVGAALRRASVSAPLLGDDRLDGAPAAALLGELGPLWYVALDRTTLLQQAPATFVGAFASLRGHQPSSRDVLTYLQIGAILPDAATAPQPSRLPVTLYRLTSGNYPGQAVATSRDATP